MKPTQSILILLSLFLMFSCEKENPVEPIVCDEGLTDVDGECYYLSDLDILQDIIDVNESLSGEPVDIGTQIWTDGRLTYLNISYKELTSIPESIGDLSSLEELIIYKSQLTSIPESIGNLSSIELLWLQNNQLTTIPESIRDLSSLEWLDLHSNQLTTLPDSIGNLSSLVGLWLYDNQLTTIPESIRDLSSLERLWLYNNQLTTIPESICNLTDLNWSSEYVNWNDSYIYNNNLCSSIPTCIVEYLGEQDCPE